LKLKKKTQIEKNPEEEKKFTVNSMKLKIDSIKQEHKKRLDSARVLAKLVNRTHITSQKASCNKLRNLILNQFNIE